ncbi:hypothetical protein RND81_10G015900 [Saponaria officinalis]|uniref:Uncharacterized protein n=1 Tax=Saponaria officinalis TaxID=3572 RepID=A0AAW1HZE1_SAPOF
MVDENNKMKELKHENGEVEKHDCFVVDLESFSSSVHYNESTSLFDTTCSNSTIKLQRSLSRKAPQCGMERKINDRDAFAPSSSSKDTQAKSTQEKPVSPSTLPMVTQDNSVNNHHSHHQITIKTANVHTVPDKQWGQRSSFKRSRPSWLYDRPRRILLIFATLSSIGTILLILFTLSMSKRNEKDGVVLDWH